MKPSEARDNLSMGSLKALLLSASALVRPARHE
jgi:hypothetical protein